MSRQTLIMPCPKCASTGTELAEGIRTGWFTPPTAMFRCRRCAFIAYGEAALKAAGRTQEETQEEPKMEVKKLCRWQPCEKGPVSYGWCDTHRSRIIKRGKHPRMTDAEAAAFIAEWKPQLTPPPPYRGKKQEVQEASEVPTVYHGPSVLEAIKQELMEPTPEPSGHTVKVVEFTGGRVPSLTELVEATPPPLTEAELLRRMEMYEELRRLRINAKDWAREVSHAQEKLAQALQLFAEANAKVTELEAQVFAPVTA